MASREKSIPKKLKNDAIVEAVVEIRFSTTTAVIEGEDIEQGDVFEEFPIVVLPDNLSF